MAESIGEALRAKYGTPVRLEDDADNVLVFRHASEESARAFAAANADEGRAECRGGVWISIVDLRARIAENDARYQESLSMTLTITPPPGVDLAGDIRQAMTLTEASRG